MVIDISSASRVPDEKGVGSLADFQQSLQVEMGREVSGLLLDGGDLAVGGDGEVD
jgi:hypothetical protein